MLLFHSPESRVQHTIIGASLSEPQLVVHLLRGCAIYLSYVRQRGPGGPNRHVWQHGADRGYVYGPDVDVGIGY